MSKQMLIILSHGVLGVVYYIAAAKSLSVMSESVRPHRRQPTRLPCPWDFPGKNAGVGCHFLLQCMKMKSEREVAQSCPALCDPMDCSLPGSSVHGIFFFFCPTPPPVHGILQARVLEWGAIAFSVLHSSWELIYLFQSLLKCQLLTKHTLTTPFQWQPIFPQHSQCPLSSVFPTAFITF